MAMTVTAPTAASFKQYMPACCVFHDFDIDRIQALIDEQETLLQAVQDLDNIEPAARTQYAGAIKNPVAPCSTHLLDTELADLLSCRRGSRSLFQHRLRFGLFIGLRFWLHETHESCMYYGVVCR